MRFVAPREQLAVVRIGDGGRHPRQHRLGWPVANDMPIGPGRGPRSGKRRLAAGGADGAPAGPASPARAGDQRSAIKDERTLTIASLSLRAASERHSSWVALGLVAKAIAECTGFTTSRLPRTRGTITARAVTTQVLSVVKPPCTWLTKPHLETG